MNADAPQPKVVRLSPTEMTGDWQAEVRKKLADQGFDAEATERIAGAAGAEMERLAATREADRRPSLWRRFLRLFGLAD